MRSDIVISGTIIITNTHILRAKEEIRIGSGSEAGERLSVRCVREQASRAAEHAEGERAHVGAAARPARASSQRAPRLAHAIQRYYLLEFK